MTRIALLSVSNKQGLVPLAKALTSLYDFQIISSGGTAKTLQNEGIAVTKVADYTGAAEILNGRVKTLHPKIHGGILAKKNDQTHQAELEIQNIKNIELVVVNLYPFKETVSQPDVTWDQAIENIDIGGPAMVRAAAKNNSSVAVLTSPDQYNLYLQALNNGTLNQNLRNDLALKAFEHTAAYDIAISKWLKSKIKSDNSPLLEEMPIKQTLRYGENPHQKATWFSTTDEGWGAANQIQGKELSTNNLIDLEAAISTIREFGYGVNESAESLSKTAVVIKHTNPCGVAQGDTLCSALNNALDADRVSSFGGIVALNSSVDCDTASQLAEQFLECIVAPYFDENAKKILSKKRNLRLIEISKDSIDRAGKNNIRSILGGILVQDIDDIPIDKSNWKIATTTYPSKQEEKDLDFTWRVIRHVRSNAIAVGSNAKTLGIGAGQMNRVGAAKIALESAGKNAKGAILASDGFFPFDDTVRLAAEYGIKAIIQPGGSIRDQESIDACNELNISMVLTGIRHFLH
tara:strand:- start:742 stop:2298 length:1557 start_codon:yes stop_codon:yes gene_type:complete